MPKVMIVDDEPAIQTLLEYQVAKLGFEVVTAASGEDALTMFHGERPDAVLLDINLPGMDGLEVLDRLKSTDPGLPVVMMTAAHLGGRGVADGMHSVQMAVRALTHGAYDYILKPADEFVDKVRLSLQNAIRERDDVSQVVELRQQLDETEARFANIIGDSPEMRTVFRMTEKVVATDATVLILGASGTGKELIARAIHYNSPRREKPLVILNCAAISESLLESELFGHEKGAFTGATGRKIGKFEAADGGTIFLDEIGDMPLNLQAKVLRALQEGEVVRVGGNERLTVDVRCIAATHRSLEKMVEEGTFRQDLYYRLCVYPIELPSLRERRGDIPLLAAHFVCRHSQRLGKPLNSITDQAVDALLAYDWPGNVRELENVLLRSVIVAEGDELTVDDLPPVVRGERRQPPTLAETVRRALVDAIRDCDRDLGRAALRLDIDRAALVQLAGEHGVSC